MHVLNLDPDWNTIFPNANLPFETFNFSGGEVHVKLKDTNDFPTEILICNRINSSEKLMQLILASEAVRRKYRGVKVSAYIPYLPYARQDRPMIKGEPFSLEVFSDILKIGKFDTVFTIDYHSDVAPALIKNLASFYSPFRIHAKEHIEENFGKDYVLVSPDGGALKKIYNHSKEINFSGNIFCASKVRDVSNGKIIRTTIDATDEDISGKTVWIMDDICSRGGTFMMLAKFLKEKGAKNIVLSVSHYEDVANEDEMRESGINKIYTTNSISNKESNLVKKFNI